MSFPENLFSPPIEKQSAYIDRVSYGRTCARKGTAVICGLARTVGDILPKTIARIEEVAELFSDYRVVIYENDSTDNTRNQLIEWSQRNRRVTVITETLNSRHWPQCRDGKRAAQLAGYRNRLLDEADRLGDHDYLVMLDTDLDGGWSIEGICHSLGAKHDWAMIGSYGMFWDYKRNNRLVQFDLWAYRVLGRWEPIKPIGGRAVKFAKHRRGDDMIPVWSCFGGLAIYKWDQVKSHRYDGGDCEHVLLHRQVVAKGGRIFMNPSQIVLYNFPPGYTP